MVRPSASACADIETPDLAAFNPKDMLDDPVGQQLAGGVADDLANLDNDFAVGPGREADRLDTRADALPLPDPVVAHSGMPRHMPPFPAIGPHDVVGQRQHYPLDIPRVEAIVEAPQEAHRTC